jgi:hypothetical protein
MDVEECVVGVQVHVTQVCLGAPSALYLCHCCDCGSTHALCAPAVQAGRQVGVAFLSSRRRASMSDGKRWQIVAYEFSDTSQYTGLEAALVRWQPSVVYMPEGGLSERTSVAAPRCPAAAVVVPSVVVCCRTRGGVAVEMKKLEGLWDTCGITAEPRKRSFFASKDCVVDLAGELQRLLGDASLARYSFMVRMHA